MPKNNSHLYVKIANICSYISLSCMLVFLCALQIHNTFIYPTTKGFDAEGHIQFIQYLQEFKKIPLANEGWELYQGPLYYIIASILPTLESVKFLGLCMWIVLGLTTYIFISRVFGRLYGLIGTVIVLSLPAVLYITPAIGNEFFSTVMITISMAYYLLNREKRTRKTQIITGILLGLAILSKATAIILLITIVCNELIFNRLDYKKIFQNIGLTFLITSIVGGWFYIRNIIIFHNPFIASVDFPGMRIRNQLPGSHDISFFTNLNGFFTLDIFKSQYYSLWSGTYFSWFYDAHAIMLPVQQMSGWGNKLIICSIPLMLLFFLGVVYSFWKRDHYYKFFLIYIAVLFLSYILYNFKLPYYSTVKGIFLLSTILPWTYFILKGLSISDKLKYFMIPYLFVYIYWIYKNFWILSWWYT